MGRTEWRALPGCTSMSAQRWVDATSSPTERRSRPTRGDSLGRKELEGSSSAFDEAAPSATFYLTTASDNGYPYDQPVITAFTEDGAVIARPHPLRLPHHR